MNTHQHRIIKKINRIHFVLNKIIHSNTHKTIIISSPILVFCIKISVGCIIWLSFFSVNLLQPFLSLILATLALPSLASYIRLVSDQFIPYTQFAMTSREVRITEKLSLTPMNLTCPPNGATLAKYFCHIEIGSGSNIKATVDWNGVSDVFHVPGENRCIWLFHQELEFQLNQWIAVFELVNLKT